MSFNRYNLIVGVNKLNRIRNLQPSFGWFSSNVNWKVHLECNNCGQRYIRTFSEELNIWCQSENCQSWGRFAVLKKRGRPLQHSGDNIYVSSISVEGTFDMEFDEHDSFDFTWSFTVEPGNGIITMDEIVLDDNGSYSYKSDSSSGSSSSSGDEYFGYNNVDDDDAIPYIREVWVNRIMVNQNTDLVASSDED